MPDQQRHALLEADLHALKRELDAELGDHDLSAAVTQVLATRSAPPPRRVRPQRRRLAVALVAGILVTATAAIPSARAAVTNFLDIGAVRVHREPPPGPISPTADLQLGERATLDDARTRMPVLVPTAGGFRSPDEVWLGAGGGVSLVYNARPGLPAAERTRVGLLVQEFVGDGQVDVNKYVTTGVRAQEVEVGSARGVFISGGDHYVFYDTPAGADVFEAGRLSGNALIFEQGPLTIRLEGDLSRDRMVAIAESIR